MGWWIAGKRIEEGSVRGMDQQLIWMIENLKIRNQKKMCISWMPTNLPAYVNPLPFPCLVLT